MKRSALAAVLAASSMLLVACGDDENLADPNVISGGGVGDGAIAGRINVHVIDSETNEPVSGADVYIGEPGEEPLTGTTDTAGLLQIDDGSLNGPTTVTVVASGYAASTWFGANGVNVTIPIDPEGTSSSIPQAEVSGTIDGWDTMDDPPANHFFVALIGYSQNNQLGDAANNLPQPGGGGGLPGNACIKAPQLDQCDFTANVRTGSVALIAVIIDVDTKGNMDDSDDETTIIGYAYKTGMTVEDGVDQSGVELTMVDVANLTDITVTSGTPPTALDTVGHLAGIDLGDDGIVQLGFGQDGSDTLTVPALTGAFADATYQAIGFAQMGEDGDGPQSIIIQRGVTDLSVDIDLGDWLGLPADLDEASGEYSFTPVDGASLHVVDLDGANNREWSIALLDGRTTFTLPSIDPSPLSASYDMTVNAFDGAVDLTDFSVDDFTDTFDRISGNVVTIGN